MQLYDRVSFDAAESMTKAYSTSFSAASRLFPSDIRSHIYNIYGLVRLADEIVDSYDGDNAGQLLDNLEAETYQAIKLGYSPNLIVHAYAQTARKYDINKTLITPFFASMRSDLSKKTYTRKEYETYIYGSAEVVGLMCLKVFCRSPKEYTALEPGAKALGAAFQKINFLRDFADDWVRLERCYFPGVTFETFDNAALKAVIQDVQADLRVARQAIAKLPPSAKPAVQLAYNYYSRLLDTLLKQSADDIKQTRFRIPNWMKAIMYAQIRVRRGWQRG